MAWTGPLVPITKTTARRCYGTGQHIAVGNEHHDTVAATHHG
ncbi:hypothetical protein [Nonomuraea maheshkhaliensis]